MINAPAGAKAVVFDFFGTLTTAVRRGPLHSAIARSLGCEPYALLAALDRTFRQRARGALGTPGDTLRDLAAEQGANPSEAELARAVADRVDAVRADTVLRPDAVPVLRAIRRLGLRTAIVSDCWYELPAFLPHLPIAALLDARVYSFDVGRCKPHPALYRVACRRLRVHPRNCLYVGDGGGRELSGARALGMTAVRLAAADLDEHLAYESESGWDGLTVRRLAELIPLLLATRPPGAHASGPRLVPRPRSALAVTATV